jgi:hypothetical protein
MIRRTAEFTGEIRIHDIRVLSISPWTTGGPGIVGRDHPRR